MRRLWNLLLVAVVASGCTSLREFYALQHVDFSLDRVTDLRLADVDLSTVRSLEDVGVMGMTALGLAIARNEVPLTFQLHVLAENPQVNGVQARLLRMDWTLLLQGRETLSGSVAEEILLPPGEPQDIPIGIRLNLVEFFEGNAQDLLDLALSLAGQGGEPKEVALQARPVIDTPLGGIRYPGTITIVRGEIGGIESTLSRPVNADGS